MAKEIIYEGEVIQRPEIPLSAEQEMFCYYYLNRATEDISSGGHAYARAYGKSYETKEEKDVAYSSSIRLLNNPKVLKRMNQLLESVGLNDTLVDVELLYLIKQNSELNTKLGAIKEYNRLKERIGSKVPDVNIQVISYERNKLEEKLGKDEVKKELDG